MGSNPHWFAQQRARGVCHLCKRAMDDRDPRLAHRECTALSKRGYRASDIQAHPPVLEPLRPLQYRVTRRD